MTKRQSIKALQSAYIQFKRDAKTMPKGDIAYEDPGNLESFIHMGQDYEWASINFEIDYGKEQRMAYEILAIINLVKCHPAKKRHALYYTKRVINGTHDALDDGQFYHAYREMIKLF